MKPEFDKAGKVLAANDPPVTLAKVDCTEAGKDTCGRFEVRGYPTVKIFRNGELSSDYNGPREAPGIIKTMKSQAGPASKELKNEKDLAATKEKSDVVIVGLFGSASEAEPFLKAANQLREDADFAHSTVNIQIQFGFSAPNYLNGIPRYFQRVTIQCYFTDWRLGKR